MDNLKHYERIKKIGKGTFGAAYLVKSHLNQRLYVVKSIPALSKSVRPQTACLKNTSIKYLIPE